MKRLLLTRLTLRIGKHFICQNGYKIEIKIQTGHAGRIRLTSILLRQAPANNL